MKRMTLLLGCCLALSARAQIAWEASVLVLEENSTNREIVLLERLQRKPPLYALIDAGVKAVADIVPSSREMTVYVRCSIAGVECNPLPKVPGLASAEFQGPEIPEIAETGFFWLVPARSARLVYAPSPGREGALGAYRDALQAPGLTALAKEGFLPGKVLLTGRRSLLFGVIVAETREEARRRADALEKIPGIHVSLNTAHKVK